MAYEKELLTAFRIARNVFTKSRNVLEKRGVSRPAANFSAYGARGTFQSFSRDAAKKQFKSYFGITPDPDNDFLDAVIDINARAIQQYYNAMDSGDADSWVDNNLTALEAAYARAIAGHIRSEQYNKTAGAVMQRYGVNSNVQKVLKEYAFAALDEAMTAASNAYQNLKWV
jgi:hypothetical protein